MNNNVITDGGDIDMIDTTITGSTVTNTITNNDAKTFVLSSIEYRDDFIWIIPSLSSSSSSQALQQLSKDHVVPLLPSTVELLRQHLQEPISVPFITSIDDTVTYPNSNNTNQSSIEDNGVEHVSNGLVTSLNINDDDDGHHNDTNEEDTPVSKSPLQPVSSTTSILLSLSRNTGLADHIMNTINDFRTIRRNNATKIGISHQLEQKEQNHHHRRRRQNRRTTNHGNNNTAANPGEGKSTEVDVKESVDNNIDTNNIVNDNNHKNDADDDDDDDLLVEHDTHSQVMASAETSAWYMLIATLNSLRILTPILFHIIWHPQRNNTQLVLPPPVPPQSVTNNTTVCNDTTTTTTSVVVKDNYPDDDDEDDDDDDDDDDYDEFGNNVVGRDEKGNNNKSRNRRSGRSRNAKCWLIGTFVFDICNVRQCKFIWKNLEHLYYLLGIVPLTSSSSTMTNKEQEQILMSYMKMITTTMEQLMIGYSSSITTCAHDNDNNNDDATSNTLVPPIVPSSSSSLSYLNYHPFDAMDEYDQTKLYMSTKILDQRFQLQLNTDLMNQNDKREKDAYLKAIYELHEQLKGTLSNRYPGSRISMYGSCLSDLSLGKNADVDFSLYIEELADTKNDYEMKKITEDTYRTITKKYVYTTCRLLERHRKQRFQNMVPVAHARVPVVKGNYVNAGNPHAPDGSLDFDICFINDIAVSNSELIRQYSLVSDTVKSLMILVKRWAKANHLASTQDNSISSYAWMNLVIYYMQCIGIVPNLQCPKLMKLVNHTTNKDGAYWDNVNFLNTKFVTWEQASTVWTVPEHRQKNMSITALLYGFFDFYVKTFPSNLYMISIATGASIHAKPKSLFNKASFFWCIEDPFELADSYCPHDLGMHASEPGSALILERLRAAETYLRTQLLQVLDMDSDETTTFLSNIQSLWPPVKLSSSGKDEPKTNNRGNARRKEPIRTTGNVEDMNIEAKPEVWPTLATPATAKKAATSHVKLAPAIPSIRNKSSNMAKPNNGATTIKPIHRRPTNTNNSGNRGKTGPSPNTVPPTMTNPKPPGSSTNSNNNNNNINSGGNRNHNNNSNNSRNNNTNNNNNDPRRRRRPPPKKTTTTTSVVVGASTVTASSSSSTVKPPPNVTK